MRSIIVTDLRCHFQAFVRCSAPERVFIVELPRAEPMDLDSVCDPATEGAMQSPEEDAGRGDKPSGANAANHNHYSSKSPST